ncbi:MAG: twin-arginine translocation signal domain-containing protein, partial [Hyphomicrobiales bacterium]|nr:twin-arginine translocation signal domain-containing protein [Hyphomicrobiales bacterium]
MTKRSDHDLDYPDIDEYDEKIRPQVEALIAGERRMLSERQAAENQTDEEVCECRDGMFPGKSTTRRGFMAGAAAAAAAAPVAAHAAAPPGAMEFDVPADPTKVQGRLTNDDGGYGSRSQFEAAVR